MSWNSDEILLGKLALAHGFISRERLEICIKDQETAAEPLGAILVRRGFITAGDLQTLLAEQERNLQKRHDTSLQRKQDSLFGRLAVTLGFVKQSDANASIREQAQLEGSGVRVRLGKLMVQRGLLTVEHVVRILEIQRKQVLWCEKCDTMFNAPRPEGDSTFRCRNCGAPLALPQKITHCEVD